MRNVREGVYVLGSTLGVPVHLVPATKVACYH